MQPFLPVLLYSQSAGADILAEMTRRLQILRSSVLPALWISKGITRWRLCLFFWTQLWLCTRSIHMNLHTVFVSWPFKSLLSFKRSWDMSSCVLWAHRPHCWSCLIGLTQKSVLPGLWLLLLGVQSLCGGCVGLPGGQRCAQALHAVTAAPHFSLLCVKDSG